MRTYNNEYNINETKLHTHVILFCPLGNDYYDADVSIDIKLDKKIVDFIDLESYFKKELNGREFTMEKACDIIINHLRKHYDPFYINCTLFSRDYLDITCTKIYER